MTPYCARLQLPQCTFEPLLNMGLTEISRSLFEQSSNSVLMTQLYFVGVFCKFLDDFGVYLRDCLSERIGNIKRNQKFWRFYIALKLKFEGNNKWRDTQTVPNQSGDAPSLGSTVYWCSKNIFLSFLLPFFKPLRISFNVMYTPP